MQITGWPNNVNQKILDETGITIGEGGFIEDQTSSGFQDRRNTALAVPDSFSVVMDFDWGGEGSEFQFKKDANGDTEYDRFIKWYKFVHKRGAVPFWFPCITKHSVDNLSASTHSDMCLYKITSSLQPKQSANSMRIQMTWKEIYSGTIAITEDDGGIDRIEAYSDHCDIIYKKELSVQPLYNQFDFYYQQKTQFRKNADGSFSKESIVAPWLPKQVMKLIGSGKRMTIYYDPLPSGDHIAYIMYQNERFPAEGKEVSIFVPRDRYAENN